MNNTLKYFLAIASLTVAVACTDDDIRLEGKREAVTGSIEVDIGLNAPANSVMSLSNPKTCVFIDNIVREGNCKGSSELSNISIVKASRYLSYDSPLFSKYLIKGDFLYSLDSDFVVNKIDLTGNKNKLSLQLPVSFVDSDTKGGGIAIEGNNLIAASGSGQLFNVDLTTFKVKWTVKMGEPAHVAPLIFEDKIFVRGINRLLSAFSLEDGTLIWSKVSNPSGISYMGSAELSAIESILGKPAIIVTFSSGEMQALRPASGLLLWSSSFTKANQFQNIIHDWASQPIIDNGRIIASNISGGISLLDAISGKRLWWREVSLISPAWVSGNVLFGISSEANLFAMDKNTGRTFWKVALQKWDSDKKKKIIARFGPVLFGGNLLLFEREGNVIAFDPLTGKKRWESDFGWLLASSPFVDKESLYVPQRSGSISVIR